MNHGWEKKRLGDVCDIYQPKTISTKDLVEGGEYDVFGANGIIGKYNSYNHEESEVLLTCRGATCGTINVSKPKSWINGNAMVVHPTTTKLLKPYLQIVLKSVDYTGVITGAAQPQITRTSLEPVRILIPTVEKQEQIVSELGKINELIAAKRSQLKDLDALAQSLFYETFGDPLENSKRWNVGTLSEYANFKNGLNFTPADDGNKIKCLGVGDFKSNRYIKTENLPEINIVEAVSEEYRLKDGDIILVRSNGNKALIGRSIMYVSDNSLATFSGFCIRCRYNREKLAPLFLSYYLSCGAIREYITSQGRGCNISNLNQKILSGIPLILPPLSLQNEFAEKIEAIEEQKRLIESSIANLETLLASRMDYWFNEI